MRASIKRSLKIFARVIAIIVVFFVLPVGCQWAKDFQRNQTPWWQLRRDSSEQAPPANSDDAVIQVYAARAARWRGNFGVHTWMAYKRTTDRQYSRIEVIGYYAYYGNNTVRQRSGNPDGYWFGSRPTLLREITGGADVDAMIDRLEASAASYPYPTTYHVWPGPNSNTFIAWVARDLPELRLELPPHAVGKDYLPNGALAAITPSRTGVQLSLRGYASLLVGAEEGLEVNLLGLTVGLDVWPPAIKLPALGRIGFNDVRRYHHPD